MMRWFGENSGSKVNATFSHAPTPVGDFCMFCNQPILKGDSGVLLYRLMSGGAWTEKPTHLQGCIEALQPKN